MQEVEQLNKIQLKAEVLTAITRLQTLQDATKVDEILYFLLISSNEPAPAKYSLTACSFTAFVYE